MNNSLTQSARKLQLTGLLGTLPMRLQEAASHQLTHEQFLELILQDELTVRADRQVQRRTKAASFRERKTLEDFDWSFNTSIKRAQLYELAGGHFIRQRRDVLLLGPPGVGKSHLTQALGYAAIKSGFVVLYCSVFDLVRHLQADSTPEQAERTLGRYLKPDLLCIDDFGMKHFPPKSAESLLEIIVRRHQLRSTLMTSNRPVEEWGQLLGDAPSATAILDRFLQQAEILHLTGRSYRMREVAKKKDKKASGPAQSGTETDPQTSSRQDQPLEPVA